MTYLKAENLYYLGPEGSNSHYAQEKFTKEIGLVVKNKVGLTTIKAALKALDSDKNSVAVLPIENSLEGIVRETIDNLIRLNDNDINIMAEYVFSINNCLLAKTTDRSLIKTVTSHPQALAQCSEYLDRNFPNVLKKDETSTSAAAKKLAESDDVSVAVIANEMAAKLFNLNILDEPINDEKDNKTRFILLGRGSTKQTGLDKTSIAFATKNESGALFQVLKVFNDYQLNLSYIDSRPSKKNLGEYVFFIDFEGHKEDEKVKNALRDLQSYVHFLKINGSFEIYKRITSN